MTALLDLEIKVTSDAVDRELAKLADKLKNHRPLLVKIGAVYLASAKLRFSSQTAPSGRSWKRNTTTTRRLKATGMKGKPPAPGAPPGTWTGRLKNSLLIDFPAGASSVSIGTRGVPYARTFGEGAKLGQFGKGIGDQPAPWADIPARPFLGATKRANDEVEKVIADYLKL